MSGIDVIARLQLNAEQFSSETGQAFAGMKARAQNTAQEVRSSFAGSFADVQKLARQSLVLPRTASGSLNLGGEIAELERAAAASDRRAIALREISVAQTAAAATGQTGTAVLRQEADASAVASLAEEKDAVAIRDRIAALRAVQGELDKTASATTANRAQVEEGVKTDGRATVAKAMLQHQLRAIGDSFASGAPLSMIFGQHIGSVAEMMSLYGQSAQHGAAATKEAGAASEEAGGAVDGLTGHVGEASEAAKGMGGKLAAVGEFLAGPWGLALTAGVTILAPLIGNMLEHNNAVGDAVKKLKEQAAQEAVTAEAASAFGKTLEGVSDAIRLQEDALGKLENAGASAAKQLLDQARAEAAKIPAIRAEIAANLDLADSMLAVQRARASDPGQRGEIASLGDAGLGGVVQGLRDRLAKSDAESAKIGSTIERAQALVSVERGERDQAQIIRDQYDGPDGLIAKARQRALAEHKVGDELERQARALGAQRDAAIKKVQDAARATDHTVDQRGRVISFNDAASIIRGIGGTITPDGGVRSHAEQARIWRDKQAGRHIGPVAAPGTSAHETGHAADVAYGTGISLATLEAAFKKQGVRLTKMLDEPSQHVFHIEWAKDAAAAREAREETHDLAAEQRQLRQDVEALTGAFDPAAAAALEYSKSLAEIARLSAAGGLTFGQQLSYSIAARERFQAATARPLPEHPFGDNGSLMPGLHDLESDHASRAAMEERDRVIEEARREQGADTLRYLSGLYGDLFNGQTKNIFDNLKRLGSDAVGDFLAKETQKAISHIHLPKGLTDLLKGSVGEGGAYGAIGGSVFSAITGGKNNTVASQVGGVLGDVAGKALGKIAAREIGGALGKTLGGAAGPIGSIVGGILGDVVGGLFKKKQNSGAGISTAGGVFGAGTAIGTSDALRGQASGLAGSVSSGLQKIADQLGASITGSSDVRIGTSNGNIHINTHGGTIGQKGSGDVNFGSDQEGAIKAAIADALADGVLSGISAAAQRILKSGQDIDRALSKALSIEAIPKDLKAMLDPVGAALDSLNTKWKATKAALDEGGASAEQYAQAERLYKLQLDQVKASTASASQGLKDFLLTLKVGSASPLSLRDQEATAKAALQPFLDTIAGGGNVDQSKYQSAAQSFLDIERQLYGSTQAFFDQFDAIQAATNRAIDAIDNAVPITPAVTDPFVKATADSTAATATGVTTSNELLAQVSDTLATATALLQGILGNTAGGGSSGFIGAGRSFTVAA